MIFGHPHVCLFRPEIPQNAGNIGRLCAATQTRMHMIRPFGFDASDRQLLRPGLDYWPYLDLEIHESFEDFCQAQDSSGFCFFSKTADKSYLDLPLDSKFFIFGQETCGLPQDFRERYPDNFYKIPIFHSKVRSLNLANSVAIVVYHYLAKKAQEG